MKKFTTRFTTIILLVMPLWFGANAGAAQPTPSEFEIPSLSIKLSNDGTGIIQNVSCGDCDYNFVKITSKTLAYANGKKVDVLRARERAGKQAFIQFVRTTGEVVAIYWNE